MARKSLCGFLAVLALGISGVGTHTCAADLSVLQGPVCTVSPSSVVICAGGSATFCATVSDGTPPYTYCWQKAPYTDPCICTEACFMILGATVDDAGTYRVVVTDEVGDSTICYANLTVDSPTCTVEPAEHEVCEGGSATFCATGMGGTAPYTFRWNTGETTACVTKSVPGTYEVTVTDALGCSATCSGILVVHPIPDCVITGNDEICEGEFTVFCATEGMAIYTWTGPYGFSAYTRCIAVGDDLAPGIYTYQVTISDEYGCVSSCSRDLFVVDCAGLPNVLEIPTAYALRQPEPNPFGGKTLIMFDMPLPGTATIRVFDVNGRVVRTLIEGEHSAGRHSVTWMGEDDAGHFVGSGTYLVRFQAGDFTETKKITVLR